jgi:tellurite methyltransferase
MKRGTGIESAREGDADFLARGKLLKNCAHGSSKYPTSSMGFMTHAPSAELRAQFGDIDIYLFDQLLRGRFDGMRRVLDAGCGSGRNLPYLLARGFEVFAIDADEGAVDAARRLAAALAPALPPDNIRHGPVDAMPWPDGSMDAVICSAVLHFARGRDHFDSMVDEMWRVLAPGGLFFARLASSIGIESLVSDRVGCVRLPDGSDRFVVDERYLLDTAARLGGSLVDPIKTTNVQNQRCMTTWVMRKR